MLQNLKSDMVSVYFYINVLGGSGLLFILLLFVFYTLIANQFFLITFFYFTVCTGLSIAMEALEDPKLFYTAYFKCKFFKINVSTKVAKPGFVRCVWECSSCILHILYITSV